MLKAVFTVSSSTTIEDVHFAVDLSAPTDLSIPVTPTYTGNLAPATSAPQASAASVPPSFSSSSSSSSSSILSPQPTVDAFYLPGAVCAPVTAGSWVGDIRCGSSVNCFTISVCPHGAGTHTECLGHILPNGPTVEDISPSLSMHPALLVTAPPRRLGDTKDTYYSGEPDDLVIDYATLKAAVDAAVGKDGTPWKLVFSKAMLIRTNAASLYAPSLTNTQKETAHHTSFSGKNPPYFTKECADYLRHTLHCRVLVCDLPSVDRENDQGKLVVHHTILDEEEKENLEQPKDVEGEGDGEEERKQGEGKDGDSVCSSSSTSQRRPAGAGRSVTELARFPAQSLLGDGTFLLDLHVSPIRQDAAPSRPVIYKAVIQQ